MDIYIENFFKNAPRHINCNMFSRFLGELIISYQACSYLIFIFKIKYWHDTKPP